MKFFSAEWARLESEADSNRVCLAYEEHLARFPGRVGGAIRDFISQFSLHDALFDHLFLSEAARLAKLKLVAGDNQSGYVLHEITYLGASLDGTNIQSVAELLDRGNSELRFDEFDFVTLPTQQCFVHRFLLAPLHRGEFGLSFQDLRIQSVPLTMRGYVTSGPSFEVER